MAEMLRPPSGSHAGNLTVPGQSSKDSDVLTTEDCSGSDEEDNIEEPDMVGMPPDFSMYWKEAIKTQSDYTAWTKLVAYAEKQKNLAAFRKAYDAFLAAFPLSHIYWRKYADIEQRLGNTEEAEQIFSHAVKSNPLNVTLWTTYILFLFKKVNRKVPNSAEQLQGVFNEAIDACGLEFRSDELWSLYAEYEIKHCRFQKALAVYNRLLNIPTQRYEMHFERFKILVSTRSPVEYLTAEELNTIYVKIQADNDDDQIASEDLPSDDIADSLTDLDLQRIRQHVLDTGKQMYLLNVEQVNKRCGFEDGIKRLYFFATPLSIKQLQNWRNYLNFEMAEGHHERVVVLFERCLMPCAKYEEFWLLYIHYMEVHSVEAARSIFERACRIHLPRKYTLHLQWALFEEKHGQVDSTRAILCNIDNAVPGVIMVRLRRVNFERRSGNLQEAERLLREAVQNSPGSEMAAFYTGKLARFLLKLKRDPEKAREVLIEGLKKEPNSPFLHEFLLETEISRNAVDDVMRCVEKAQNSNIHDAVKGIMSQRRLEFMEDCGNSIKSLLYAYDEHQMLLMKQEELKRKENDKDKEVTKNKKAKSESDNSSVIEDVPIPGVSPVVSPVVSKQSVSTTVSSTSTSTSETIVKVPEAPKTGRPTPKEQFTVPRSAMQPFIPPNRAAGLPFVNPMPRAFPPPPRMGPPMPPPYYMGRPPGPFPPGPVPPYSYGPWYQNFGGYSRPPPWNYNRFYPPF